MSHLWLSLVLYARDVAFISLSAISGWDASGCAFPMHSVLSSKGSQRSLVCMFHSRDNHGWWICRRLLYSCNAESSIHGPFKLMHQRHSPMKEVPHYTIIVWLKTVIWCLTFGYHTTPVCSAFSRTHKSFFISYNEIIFLPCMLSEVDVHYYMFYIITFFFLSFFFILSLLWEMYQQDIYTTHWQEQIQSAANWLSNLFSNWAQ